MKRFFEADEELETDCDSFGRASLLPDVDDDDDGGDRWGEEEAPGVEEVAAPRVEEEEEETAPPPAAAPPASSLAELFDAAKNEDASLVLKRGSKRVLIIERLHKSWSCDLT